MNSDAFFHFFLQRPLAFGIRIIIVSGFCTVCGYFMSSTLHVLIRMMLRSGEEKEKKVVARNLNDVLRLHLLHKAVF